MFPSRGFALGMAHILLLACLGAAPVSAQDGPVGFRFAFGSQHMGGDIGDALDRAIDAEFSILVPVSFMRVGGGANWGSFDVIGEEESWSQVRFHLLAGYAHQLTSFLRPYAEARWTYRRLRPEDERFFGDEEEELLRDFVSQGGGVEGVLGVELVLAPKFALDLSGAFGSFSVSPDLSEEGFGPIDSGSTWRLHAGVTWFPMNER